MCCLSVLSSSGVDDTPLVLCVKVLMTLYLAVLLCMDGFSVYACVECSIRFWCDQCVQEWHKTMCPCVFCYKFDGTIYKIIDILKEIFFAFCALYHKCIIHEPLLWSR